MKRIMKKIIIPKVISFSSNDQFFLYYFLKYTSTEC